MRRRKVAAYLLAYVIGVLLFLLACAVYDLGRSQPPKPSEQEQRHP